MDDIGLYHNSSRSHDLSKRFHNVRAVTEVLAADLTEEDQCVQSMPDASPAKWHRAHVTWFFEQFVLVPHVPAYRVFDPSFGFLFNSYYEAVGPRHPRPSRGLLTRPSASQVTQYRRHVDAALEAAIPHLPGDVRSTIELGLQHEQQHQELLVTDMLHAFAAHPLCPAMMTGWQEPVDTDIDTTFIASDGGLRVIGNSGSGFCFDNETPPHQVFLQPHALASRLVRNRDWLGFIQDNGYATPSLWMSDGWAAAQREGWTAPLYLAGR